MDLTEKLQIKPGHSLAILNPPPGVTLPASTPGAQPSTASAVIGFAVHRDDLDQLGAVIGAALADRVAWIGYPKGGKLGTDLNRDRLAQALASHGIQPVRQVSIDGTWSALHLASWWWWQASRRTGGAAMAVAGKVYAVDDADPEASGASGGGISLLDAVRHVSPTILLGTSTAHGAFTREVIEAMSAGLDRPIVFPISNPTSRTEAMPAHVTAWSKGKALVAVGIPVGPVEYAGVTYQIGQANNALLYPGLGPRPDAGRLGALCPHPPRHLRPNHRDDTWVAAARMRRALGDGAQACSLRRPPPVILWMDMAAPYAAG